VSFNYSHGERSPAVEGTALYNAIAGPLEPCCPGAIAGCECAEWWDCPRDREMMQAETGDWEAARRDELRGRVER
jgi:hypothetical protein